MQVNIKNTSKHPLPHYSTEHSAGLDLRANIDEPIVLNPLERALVPTGLFIELPEGYEAQIRPRSGLAYKHGLSILNAPGTIDADYRARLRRCWLICPMNHSPYTMAIESAKWSLQHTQRLI